MRLRWCLRPWRRCSLDQPHSTTSDSGHYSISCHQYISLDTVIHRVVVASGVSRIYFKDLLENEAVMMMMMMMMMMITSKEKSMQKLKIGLTEDERSTETRNGH